MFYQLELLLQPDPPNIVDSCKLDLPRDQLTKWYPSSSSRLYDSVARSFSSVCPNFPENETTFAVNRANDLAREAEPAKLQRFHRCQGWQIFAFLLWHKWNYSNLSEKDELGSQNNWATLMTVGTRAGEIVIILDEISALAKSMPASVCASMQDRVSNTNIWPQILSDTFVLLRTGWRDSGVWVNVYFPE
jgi:hypothetical protein